MLIDLHTHSSRHSGCSYIDPVSLVRGAVQKHLQGVVLTEHHYLWDSAEIEVLYRDAEVPRSFVILSGQEVDTDIGHVLVFGAPESITEPLSLSDLKKKYPDTALVMAHPFRKGRMPDKEKLCHPLIDAVEIFTSNHSMKESYRALSAWHHLEFVAVSGSDTHASETIGLFPTQFDHPVFSIDDLVRQLHNGACRPFFKEVVKSGSNIDVIEIAIGTKGFDEQRNRLIAKHVYETRKWDPMCQAALLMKELYDKVFKRETLYRIPRIFDIDDEEMLLLEEGQRGELLYELLLKVTPSTGVTYWRLAARWLAKMHSADVGLRDTVEAVDHERYRRSSYERLFEETKNSYLNFIRSVIDTVFDAEERLFRDRPELCTICHGDYHLKNIIIGHDKAQDLSTVFISVIDFDSAIRMHPAFDVGCFLTQFDYQLMDHPEVLNSYDPEEFIDTYAKAYGSVPDRFNDAVAFFRLRSYLSIAAFLIRVGKGESDDMRRLMDRIKVIFESVNVPF